MVPLAAGQLGNPRHAAMSERLEDHVTADEAVDSMVGEPQVVPVNRSTGRWLSARVDVAGEAPGHA